MGRWAGGRGAHNPRPAGCCACYLQVMVSERGGHLYATDDRCGRGAHPPARTRKRMAPLKLRPAAARASPRPPDAHRWLNGTRGMLGMVQAPPMPLPLSLLLPARASTPTPRPPHIPPAPACLQVLHRQRRHDCLAGPAGLQAGAGDGAGGDDVHAAVPHRRGVRVCSRVRFCGAAVAWGSRFNPVLWQAAGACWQACRCVQRVRLQRCASQGHWSHELVSGVV